MALSLSIQAQPQQLLSCGRSSLIFENQLLVRFQPNVRSRKRLSSSTPPRPALRVKASWQDLAGVVIFSAIPFTAVKALANSPLGKRLQQRLEERKKNAVENSSKLRALAQKARKDSPWYGENRPRWLGPIPYNYPGHLTGELPGDYGFDLAGFGMDPSALQKFYNFEILHARWAMLAALGAVVPELLNLYGAFQFVEPVWWRVGYSKLKGDTLDYLGIPGLHLAGSQGVVVIAICQILLMFKLDPKPVEEEGWGERLGFSKLRFVRDVMVEMH